MMTFALTPPEAKDNRFRLFRAMVSTFYLWRWKHECPWGPAEANQLSRLLKTDPSLDLQTFKRWLYNYGMSEDIAPGERPCRFLPRIHNYSVVPLDRFGRSQDATIDTAKAQAARRTDAAFERVRARYLASQGTLEHLPEQTRINRSRDRALASGLKQLSDGGD